MAALSREVRNLILSAILDEDDSALCFVAVEEDRVLLRTALMLNQQEENNPDAHVDGFVERVVPTYTGSQFKSHFRMFPDAFESLCQWLGPHLSAEKTLSIETKLLSTIWLLGNMESYRSVADRFGMNRGTLHRLVKEVYQTLVVLRGDVLSWPQSASALRKAAIDFQEVAGFPGVVGALDGTYIPIKGTTDDNRTAYICRKGYPAMHLQVVCNRQLLFIDVDTGCPGSVADSRVFRNSDLASLLENPVTQLPGDLHLLGDSAYSLREFLLVPFRDNGHLSPVELRYNWAHSSTRSTVERAIGLLKGKFRRLKSLDMTNLHDAPYLIFACCVLHNFIILRDGVDDEDIEFDPEDQNVPEADEGRERRSASEKRHDIANLL